MKKTLLLIGMALLSFGTMHAQEDEGWIPKHVGVGVGLGTNGVSIDASTNINKWFGVRAGVNIFPTIKVKTDIDLGIENKTNGVDINQMSRHIDNLNAQIDAWNATHPANRMDRIDKSLLPDGNLPNSLDIEGKLKNTTFHFLVDVYPFGDKSSFHATVGAYFGPSKVVKVYNREDGFLTPVNQWNQAILTAQQNPTSTLNTMVVEPNNLQMIGAELGDYFIAPNPADNGNVEASIKVSGFRPYLGIGFGRAVPKNRIGCQFDMGVQFWGTPKVYAPTYNKATGEYQNEKLSKGNTDGKGGSTIKTISKISVYPVISFRLVGRIL